MNITLRYDGHIPSEQNDKTREFHSDFKQQLRRHFSTYFKKLWKTRPLLEFLQLGLPEAPYDASARKCGPVDTSAPFFRVPIAGFSVVPLVSWHNRLACELEIVFLGEPFSIVTHAGDIDNKLKVVFDALRMPTRLKEVPGHMMGKRNEDLWCLLEDDRLIRKFTVEARESYGSPMEEELSILVKVVSNETSHPLLDRFR